MAVNDCDFLAAECGCLFSVGGKRIYYFGICVTEHRICLAEQLISSRSGNRYINSINRILSSINRYVCSS